MVDVEGFDDDAVGEERTEGKRTRNEMDVNLRNNADSFHLSQCGVPTLEMCG